ncbi:MAG TPA: hypothetical protein PK325_03735 [Cyclobacteriaceae bacterium]|nr:hypothetical protein [Cyclobacteriaceae bacterium]HMV07924.1 hypothetical protein [Cyclobacteriaceae bacterium]HMV88192.1 hypothetical protein [Cyclobacteriaceae bacterium]HMW99058.1 hypothetical protein [Cyclobacteriaceae bacterium]HMX48309.1 hypothetical protein [Cyclobacteriaceae bacterium]
MALYIIISFIVALIVVFGFWAARQQKKRLKQAEEFYALPQIRALLESGFTKDEDAIVGMIHEYPAGLYCWFEVTGPRYFTYLRCKSPAFSTVYTISNKYHNSERIRIKNGALEQELKQIDGDTLAKSFARLQEVAAMERLEPVNLTRLS